MAESSAMPAIMTVSEDVYTDLIPRLRESDFFKDVSNGDLLLYACALGAAHSMEVPIKRAHNGGLARRESFSQKFIAVIKALHVARVGENDPDGICDQAAAFFEAERYANGGFEMIESDLTGNPNAETYANRLIGDLDKRYEQIKGRPAV